MKQPTVYLISCGDELLFGHTVDTNSAWLAEQCTLLGWRILGHRTIGDVTPDIVAAFREAADKADVVLVTGGLGPTADDRTRYALAETMGVGLYEDAEAVEEIAARFRAYNRVMGEANKVQALIPETAVRIKNNHGTAPGIDARLGSARLFAMPGVPGEMRAMFRDHVEPLLRGAPGAKNQIMLRLHLCGKGESDVGEAIRDLMREKANPEIGTTVADSIITVRLYANGESETEAEQVAVEAEKKIRQVLGDDIFGVDGQSLPQAVIELLKQRGAGLVLAESCTGGMVASMIVDVAGSSAVLKEGVVTYANESKINRLGVDPEILRTYGAVSPECCAAMAEGALKTSKFPAPLYSLATTGVAGPDGGTEEKPVGTVWIACSRLNPDGTGTTRLLHYKTLSTRNSIRMRAANAALDLLRRTLLGLEGEFPVIDSTWKLS